MLNWLGKMLQLPAKFLASSGGKGDGVIQVTASEAIFILLLGAKVQMGLVCFRLKGSKELNEALIKRINGRGNIHLVPSKFGDIYFLRMSISSRFINADDMEYSWNEICETANLEIAAHAEK